MRSVKSFMVPCDGKLHSVIPPDTVAVIGCGAEQDADGVAVKVWVECDDQAPDQGDRYPVRVFGGDTAIPDGAVFVGFVPPFAHVWQVPVDETKDEPRVKRYLPGDIHTGQGGTIFGPGSPIVTPANRLPINGRRNG